MSLDPRVERGMRAQLTSRDAALADGARRLGWKLGLATPTAFKALGTEHAMIGYLTESTILESGGAWPLADVAAPRLEAEIAIRLGADVPGDATREQVVAAVDAIAPAIELVDMHTPMEDPELIVGLNIWHRKVILGEFDTARAGIELGGMSLTVTGGEGRVYADAVAPNAASGDLAEVTRQGAWVLGQVGEQMRAGDIVITGSGIPPLVLEQAEIVTVRFDGLGEVSVDLT